MEELKVSGLLLGFQQAAQYEETAWSKQKQCIGEMDGSLQEAAGAAIDESEQGWVVEGGAVPVEQTLQ